MDAWLFKVASMQIPRNVVEEDDLGSITWDGFNEVRLVSRSNLEGPTIYAEPSSPSASKANAVATEKSPEKLLLVIVEDPYDPATQARVSSLLSQHGTSDGWI